MRFSRNFFECIGAATVCHRDQPESDDDAFAHTPIVTLVVPRV
jgi:hypothetical protein